MTKETCFQATNNIRVLVLIVFCPVLYLRQTGITTDPPSEYFRGYPWEL